MSKPLTVPGPCQHRGVGMRREGLLGRVSRGVIENDGPIGACALTPVEQGLSTTQETRGPVLGARIFTTGSICVESGEWRVGT